MASGDTKSQAHASCALGSTDSSAFSRAMSASRASTVAMAVSSPPERAWSAGFHTKRVCQMAPLAMM